MKLTKLETLAQSKEPLLEENRKWFDGMEGQIDRMEKQLNGSVLKNMLADGGFPATESAAMLRAFRKFQNEFDDFKMGVLSSLSEELLTEAFGKKKTKTGKWQVTDVDGKVLPGFGTFDSEEEIDAKLIKLHGKGVKAKDWSE